MKKLLKEGLNKNTWDKLTVLISNVLSKGFLLTFSIVIVRILAEEDYSEWVYYKSYLTLLLPISALGLEQTYLRFGSVDTRAIGNLKSDIFGFALISSVILAFCAIIVVGFIRPKELDNTFLLVLVISQLLSNQVFNFARIGFRIKNEFNSFSKNLLLTNILILFLGLLGAVISIELMAFAVLLSFFLGASYSGVFSDSLKFKLPSKEHLTYGVNIGVGGVFNKSLFTFDIIYLATLSNSEISLASYKVATIIPFNLLLISRSIMEVDFTRFVNMKKQEISHYLFSYWKKVFLLLTVLGVIMYSLEDLIIEVVFGKRFVTSGKIGFLYFCLVGIIMAFRSPFGQILNAKGESRYNLILTIIQTMLLSSIFIVGFIETATSLVLFWIAVTLFICTLQLFRIYRLQ